MNRGLLQTLRLDISISSFLDTPSNSILYSKVNHKFNGSNASKNKKDALLAMFGEYFERENFLIEYPIYLKQDIRAYDLYHKKIVILPDTLIKKKNLFNDSSGMASHLNSKSCFDNAFAEFIERQSFVFNYLSKTKGKFINKNLISEYVLLDGFCNDIDFYEISLISSFHVIIALGKIDNKFYVGLGAGKNFKLALDKCVKEINQFRIGFVNDSIKPIQSNNNMDYMDYYLMLPAKKIERAYTYLKGGSSLKESEIIIRDFDDDFTIRKLHEECSINPKLIFIDQKRCNINQKIMHIIDENWFSGINPNLFHEDVYCYIEEKMKTSLNRKCNFIPFP